MAINETNLDNNFGNETISVDGYTLRRNNSIPLRGIVGMYVINGIKYLIPRDLRVHNFEPICIDVHHLRSERFNVISWYRLPNDIIDSSQQLLRVLAFIDREFKEPYYWGILIVIL